MTNPLHPSTHAVGGPTEEDLRLDEAEKRHRADLETIRALLLDLSNQVREMRREIGGRRATPPEFPAQEGQDTGWKLAMRLGGGRGDL